MNELIFKLANIGTRHATIAHALGLSVHVLRKYFAPALLRGATEAELAALFRSGPPKPKQPKPSDHASAFSKRPPGRIVVVRDDNSPILHE